MKNVSKTTFTNITKAWHKKMVMNKLKPKAQAFISEPNHNRKKKSQINDAKQICNGLINGLSSLPLKRRENKINPINNKPQAIGTIILKTNSTFALVIKNKVAAPQMRRSVPTSIPKINLRLVIERTRENTKYDAKPKTA